MVGGSGMMMGGSAPMMSQGIATTRPRGFNGFWPNPNVMRQGLGAGGQPMIMGGGQPMIMGGGRSSVGLVKGPIPIQVAQPQRMIVQQPMVVQQPMMIQQPRIVQQPVMIQQPRVIQQPMMIQQPRVMQQPVMIQQPRVIQQPVMIQQPRIVQQPVMIQQPMVVQQPRMAVQQQPMLMNQGVQVVPQSGVQNLGTQVQDYQISPLVTERHIIQQTKKIIRKTRKPVRKQVGTQMVPTVEEVVVQNPDTMKMATEYAEPYIKRDGYTTENVGVINQKTKVIRRSGFPTRKTSLRTGRTVPILTNQVTTTGRIGMRRGYTRIDTWKHCGDAQ